MMMLNEHPRQQLQVMIVRFGHSVCDDPKLCEAILRDLCPEHKREVNLLVTALKEKIAHDLLKPPVNMPIEITLKNLSQRLQDNHGTAENFANWAMESWALSLNIIQPSLLKKAIQPAINTTPPQTKTVTPSSTQQRIGRFIVRDGIALDTKNNLIWCRFAYGQTWKNNTAVGHAKKVNWRTAYEIIRQFNQAGYQGYSDWRLPMIQELETLIDNTKTNYINADIFPNNPDWLWSSSQNNEDGEIMSFISGRNYEYGGGTCFIRFVHSYRDELYDNAVAFVVQSRKPSISAIQRQFKIGYNRASHFIEKMEDAGIVSHASHNGSRTVLINKP